MTKKQVVEDVLAYTSYLLIAAALVWSWRPVCWLVGKVMGWC